MQQPPSVFAKLEQLAQARVTSGGPPIQAQLPSELEGIDYDAYRSIRFRPERSLWRDEPGQFEVQFFHLGFYFRTPVSVYVVQNGVATPYPFRTDLFSYDRVPVPSSTEGLGYAGLRLHGYINNTSHRDEIVVFQGASYFRALGRGQVYGLSARGLAIDTGEPTGEEFPAFTEFYLVHPADHDDFAWVLALLESQRAVGAYAFRIVPGDATIIEVTARVWLREPVAVLGLAPLSSMFLFGEAKPAAFGDFRPEVHDSDGLAFCDAQGGWLFRPLRNPERTTVATFRLDSPRGFGLLQRDRDFSSYQDLEARYQDRPNAWIEPQGDWGPGALRLLEIATELETDDNVAVAWVPDQVPDNGLSLRYRISFGRGPARQEGQAKVVATRVGEIKREAKVMAIREGESKREARFVIDFVGTDLADRLKDMTVEVSATGGSVMERHLMANPHIHGARASFEVAADAAAADVELRAQLRVGSETVSETWSYLWQPHQK